jgi:hypothetical protein
MIKSKIQTNHSWNESYTGEIEVLLSALAYSRPPLIIVCCHVTLKLTLCFLGFF